MAIATTYKNPTGLQNVVASIQRWMEANVPTAGATDFTYYFTAQAAPARFPMVEVVQFPSPSISAGFAGGYAYPVGSPTVAANKYATEETLVMRITIYDKYVPNALAGTTVTQNLDPARKIRRIWDRLEMGLLLAGTASSSSVAAITVYDFDNGNADTGVTAFVPFGRSDSIIQQYFSPTGDDPTVHALRVLVRFNWYRLFNAN